MRISSLTLEQASHDSHTPAFIQSNFYSFRLHQRNATILKVGKGLWHRRYSTSK
jgi:hypothetical protein